MGRLTEYYQYLQTEPSKLAEFKQNMVWVTVKKEDKKLRRALKLYNKEDIINDAQTLENNN